MSSFRCGALEWPFVKICGFRGIPKGPAKCLDFVPPPPSCSHSKPIYTKKNHITSLTSSGFLFVMTSPPRPPHPSSVDIIYGSSISDVGEEEEDGRKCPSKLPNHLPFPSLHFFPTYLLPLGSALQCSYASRVVDFSPKSKHFGVKTVNLAARIPENNRRRGINVAW